MNETIATIAVYDSSIGEHVGHVPGCEQKIAKIKLALKTLVDKLEVVHKDLSYQGVWSFCYVHGRLYTGPNYGKELEAAKEALNEY